MERKKILLVDDIKLFLELEKTFFRREEFNLTCAENGREALELIRSQRPDLVFMDLHMPEMDGDVCCRAVKAEPDLSAIPIVIVTTAGDAHQLQRCHDSGCDAVLLKPISRTKIMDTVRRFLPVSERVEARYDARLQVSYGAEDRQILSDYTINISSGGLFLETHQPLSIDTPLQLEFHLPGRNNSIRCNGRVAWINLPDYPKKPGFPAGMGIQLTDLGLDDVHAIRDFIKDQTLHPTW